MRLILNVKRKEELQRAFMAAQSHLDYEKEHRKNHASMIVGFRNPSRSYYVKRTNSTLSVFSN